VLRARFEDARFFWDTDQKKWLGEYREKLKSVMFESRLGSYYAKVERVKAVAGWVASEWARKSVTGADARAAERAAELAKCDLVTEMVHEFPELQGVVGGLYARAQKEPEEIALAIYDQYRPAGAADELPRNLTGCALAVADKLDSLVGCFAVGAIPTGSSDPFALRRAALGIVRILLDKKLSLSTGAAIGKASEEHARSEMKIEVSEEQRGKVREFLNERARFVFRENFGFANDEISAVLAADSDDLVDAQERLKALQAVRGSENFVSLAAAFKRVRNILEKSAGAVRGTKGTEVKVQKDLFREDAERELYEAAQRIGRATGEHRQEKRYKEALNEIAQLRPAVDLFFDKVLVMAPEEDVRANRLALLGNLLGEFSGIADLSEITVEEVAKK